MQQFHEPVLNRENPSKIVSNVKSGEAEDEDMFFLKSLHLYLKQIRDKLWVRSAMITLVREHLRDQENN